MTKSSYSVRIPLIIFVFCLAGCGGCHSEKTQENNDASGTSESEVTYDVASDNSDAIVCAFFGLDNGLTRRVNAVVRGAYKKDGMPLNFKDEIDASTLDAKTFSLSTGKVKNTFLSGPSSCQPMRKVRIEQCC